MRLKIGAIKGLFSGMLLFWGLGLLAEYVELFLILSILLGAREAYYGLRDVDIGSKMIGDDIHDYLGWYYFFRGMIHFSLQTEFTLSRAKVTPIGPNNPTPGDAASAYVISDNQIVVTPLYSTDGFVNACQIVV